MNTPTPASERYRRYVADTIKHRIPVIVRSAGEGLPPMVANRINAILRVLDQDAPMVADLSDWPFEGWEGLPARVNGKRVSQAAFFDFEYWLYLRILTAVGFPETRRDPFRQIKHKDLDRHLKWGDEALGRTRTLSDALRLSLDANAHDLSQLTGPSSNYEIGFDLLRLAPGEVNRLNIIADNFGGEFIADLVLAIVAAEAGIDVVVHVKQVPMFVSDTTSDDVTILLDRLTSGGEFAQRLGRAISLKSLRFASHPFWSSPQFFDTLPLEELGQGPKVLNVVKGDLNFRRAIGDASVDIGTPFDELPVLPAAPILSLRSIKSYCVAGMVLWPVKLGKDDFPMDGSIVLAQRVGARDAATPAPTASAKSSSDGPPPLERAKRWLRRKG